MPDSTKQNFDQLTCCFPIIPGIFNFFFCEPVIKVVYRYSIWKESKPENSLVKHLSFLVVAYFDSIRIGKNIIGYLLSKSNKIHDLFFHKHNICIRGICNFIIIHFSSSTPLSLFDSSLACTAILTGRSCRILAISRSVRSPCGVLNLFSFFLTEPIKDLYYYFGMLSNGNSPRKTSAESKLGSRGGSVGDLSLFPSSMPNLQVRRLFHDYKEISWVTIFRSSSKVSQATCQNLKR